MTTTATIALSLVSHTNVGKTTLARTLLGRDIGEVRDEAHVTLEAERHTMVESPDGDRLELWDTPGFGDSVRLAKRLAQAGNPIGWFMTEVWDKYRDRAFWSSQRAVRNVLEEADVVLYLVNASESPADVGYLDAELKVLDLIGKPVIALLNQLGPPQPPADEAAEVQRWRIRLSHSSSVREVLALDAFARCWVQEGTLLRAVAAVLPTAETPGRSRVSAPASGGGPARSGGPGGTDKREAFERLRAAWQAQRRATWNASMQVLAERLAAAALDRETFDDEGFTGKLREVGAAIGLRRDGADTPRERAMRQLAERLDASIRASTDRLIRLHDLDGHATDVVLTRLAEHYAATEPLSEGKAAVVGGVLTGALAGLKADVASGGLTFGAGLLAGGVLGALGAIGIARGFNLVRGTDRPALAWTDAVLDELARSALLGYLTVVHYGRGRGEWSEGEHPAFWADVVEPVIAGRSDALQALWARRGNAGERDALVAALQHWLHDASDALLSRLYPEAPRY
jgi:hypothetical protein